MILSGLQVAAVSLVPSSGIDRRRRNGAVGAGPRRHSHGHVIKCAGRPAMPPRQGVKSRTAGIAAIL